jgi:plasmid stability protein
MATIQIRNLSDETVRAWKVRAAKSGQSLQEYMRSYLTSEALKPTVEELVERLNARSDDLLARGEAKDLPLEETLRGINETWE